MICLLDNVARQSGVFAASIGDLGESIAILDYAVHMCDFHVINNWSCNTARAKLYNIYAIKTMLNDDKI